MQKGNGEEVVISLSDFSSNSREISIKEKLSTMFLLDKNYGKSGLKRS